jgi:adenosylcobinamide-GDP ribazoletransferase
LINAFWLALEFLSAIRPPVRVHYHERSFARSLIFFPIVGLILGGLQFALARFTGGAVSPALLSILLIVINLAYTGGLHLDGVADTADGFGAGGNPEQVLAFGIAAISLLLYSKIVVYQLICDLDHLALLLLAPALSRFFLAVTISIFPYARKSGKALAFSHARYSIPGILSVVCYLPFFFFAGKEVLLPGIFIWALFQTYVYSRIRGYTGDTLGCLNEVLEVGIPFSYLCMRGAL